MNRLPGMQPETPGGAFAKLFASLLLIAVGLIALFFGAVIIAVLIGLAAILFVFLYFRAWWLRHKLGLDVHPRHSSRKAHDDRVTIEGEYTVESENQDSREKPQNR